MYNIFITPKNGIRQLVAQVSDCRAFLRKLYNDLIPVTADLDHAIWRTNDGTHIEAHSVVEKIFDVPLQEEPQKVETKAEPARESGWYWIKPVDNYTQPGYWDGNFWNITTETKRYSEDKLVYIHTDRLNRPELNSSCT